MRKKNREIYSTVMLKSTKENFYLGNKSSNLEWIGLADSFQKAPDDKEQAERVEEKNISEENRDP